MKKTLLLFTFVLLIIGIKAQTYQQYFDGADTTDYSIKYSFDSNSVWQVGPPQKLIFDSAASIPNVLITDTASTYPGPDTSIVEFIIPAYYYWSGIGAIQWLQKLDMDSARDFGMVEYKPHPDSAWMNAFNSPYLYNFYGFDSSNVGAMPNGDSAFTGTDSSWSDIWLCIDWTYYYLTDTAYLRFTFISDTIDENREGWMVDNLLAHITLIHTVKEDDPDTYMKVYPTPSKGRINIEVKKRADYHIIEHMELISVDGRVIRRYGSSPIKFWIDISDLPDGLYYLNVTTNIKSEIHPVMLQKQ